MYGNERSCQHQRCQLPGIILYRLRAHVLSCTLEFTPMLPTELAIERVTQACGWLISPRTYITPLRSDILITQIYLIRASSLFFPVLPSRCIFTIEKKQFLVSWHMFADFVHFASAVGNENNFIQIRSQGKTCRYRFFRRFRTMDLLKQ